MSFAFDDLDADTRTAMLEELKSDLDGRGIYRSDRLSPTGVSALPALLGDAFAHGSDASLGAELARGGHLNETERWAKGIRRMASNAATLLAEGEFNRYYMRAVCLTVLEAGGTEVEITRGRESGRHRPESDALIGTLLDATALLDDLRRNVLTPGEVRVLPDVNSGLTVKRPSAYSERVTLLNAEGAEYDVVTIPTEEVGGRIDWVCRAEPAEHDARTHVWQRSRDTAVFDYRGTAVPSGVHPYQLKPKVD